MDEIAKGLIDKINTDIPVLDKIRILYWIEKYLWSIVEDELDG